MPDVRYATAVVKDLKRLPAKDARRILEKIEAVLAANPNAGAPLAGKFRGMRRLRGGDYRAIYETTNDGVLVLRIRHRRHAYR